MDLHAEIMNIKVKDQELKMLSQCDSLIYKIGHRDARHVAAELALKAQARIEELESIIQGTVDCVSVYGDIEGISDFVIENLEKVLKNK